MSSTVLSGVELNLFSNGINSENSSSIFTDDSDAENVPNSEYNMPPRAAALDFTSPSHDQDPPHQNDLGSNYGNITMQNPNRTLIGNKTICNGQHITINQFISENKDVEVLNNTGSGEQENNHSTNQRSQNENGLRVSLNKGHCRIGSTCRNQPVFISVLVFVFVSLFVISLLSLIGSKKNDSNKLMPYENYTEPLKNTSSIPSTKNVPRIIFNIPTKVINNLPKTSKTKPNNKRRKSNKKKKKKNRKRKKH